MTVKFRDPIAAQACLLVRTHLRSMQCVSDTSDRKWTVVSSTGDVYRPSFSPANSASGEVEQGKMWVARAMKRKENG